jgi:hypothetical protein
MKLKIFLLLFAINGLCSLPAQEVISPAGTHATGPGIALSWTVGEPVIGTISNGSYTLTQGFHQSRLSSTATDDIVIPGLSLVVYPNPLTDLLMIRIDEGDFSLLQYSLFDLEGKILISNKISKNPAQINMETFAAGKYLLHIGRKTGEPVKTFKIVKQ